MYEKPEEWLLEHGGPRIIRRYAPTPKKPIKSMILWNIYWNRTFRGYAKVTD
jgi:hypothetical protein